MIQTEQLFKSYLLKLWRSTETMIPRAVRLSDLMSTSSSKTLMSNPVNTKHLYNIYTMLDQVV